jgi:hypothetical protein
MISGLLSVLTCFSDMIAEVARLAED